MRSIIARSTVALALALLAAGCHRDSVTSAEAPLCPSAAGGPALPTVKIEMDTVAFKVNPKDCYIHSDTEVIWVSDKDSFETNFKVKSPAHSGELKFKSKPVGVKNEASFKAKHLNKGDPQEKFDYTANTKGREMDPSVIIDP